MNTVSHVSTLRVKVSLTRPSQNVSQHQSYLLDKCQHITNAIIGLHTRSTRSASTPDLIFRGGTQIRNFDDDFRAVISAPRAIRIAICLNTIATTTSRTCTLTTAHAKVVLAQCSGRVFGDWFTGKFESTTRCILVKAIHTACLTIACTWLAVLKACCVVHGGGAF